VSIRYNVGMPATQAATLSDSLLLLLAETERGPRRDGLYAVWLTARAAADLAAEVGCDARPRKRRLDALEQRLTSLTLASPLRRGLVAALSHLRDPAIGMPTIALSQLIAPVRESLGVAAADCLAQATRTSRSGTPAPR
jgi:hypothetical protein